MKTNRRFVTATAAVIAVVLVLSGCGSTGQPAAVKALTGAGATFPYPLYSKMFDVYDGATGVRVNYSSIGSGGGIKALTDKTVDFGASDAYTHRRGGSGNRARRPAHSYPASVPSCCLTTLKASLH